MFILQVMIKRYQNVVSMSIFTDCIAYFITTIHGIKTNSFVFIENSIEYHRALF